MKKNVLIAIAVGAGIIGVIFSYLYLTAKKKDIISRGRPQTVLVASQYIEPWARISENMLRHKEIPAEYLNPGVVRDISEIEGQISIAPIAEGEQITANKFSPVEKGLALNVPEGARAFPLRLNEASLFAGSLNPGDYVDVMGTFNIMENEQNYYNFTSVLLNKVKVLSVGNRIGPKIDDDKEEDMLAPSSRDENVVSLQLSPQDSVFLAYCVERGDIKLIMRSPYDSTETETGTITLRELLKKADMSKQKIQQIREKPSMEIIRGTQRQKR